MLKSRIVKTKNNVGDIEVKRFYVPGVAAIESTCPKCKHRGECFLDYLSYPPANEPFDHALVCDACGNEWDVELLLKISLTVRDL